MTNANFNYQALLADHYNTLRNTIQLQQTNIFANYLTNLITQLNAPINQNQNKSCEANNAALPQKKMATESAKLNNTSNYENCMFAEDYSTQVSNKDSSEEASTESIEVSPKTSAKKVKGGAKKVFLINDTDDLPRKKGAVAEDVVAKTSNKKKATSKKASTKKADDSLKIKMKINDSISGNTSSTNDDDSESITSAKNSLSRAEKLRQMREEASTAYGPKPQRRERGLNRLQQKKIEEEEEAKKPFVIPIHITADYKGKVKYTPIGDAYQVKLPELNKTERRSRQLKLVSAPETH